MGGSTDMEYIARKSSLRISSLPFSNLSFLRRSELDLQLIAKRIKSPFTLIIHISKSNTRYIWKHVQLPAYSWHIIRTDER